jgi:hypothetical protein
MTFVDGMPRAAGIAGWAAAALIGGVALAQPPQPSAGPPASDAPQPAAASTTSGKRDQLLEIFPFLGVGIDNFAGSEVAHYLNPEDSGDSKTRETMGVSFQYPLYGGNDGRLGLWVYGQTTHGVRSAEIDCNFNDPALLNPKCAASSAAPTPNQQALYILRSASSLEGMIGVRFEFLPLQDGNATLYVSKQAGFVAVEDDDDDVADVNHFGFGARIRAGRFRNSYLEIGRGTNDLIALNPDDRFKLNARVISRLSGESTGAGKWLSRGFFFAHIVVDADGHDGADAVQTFIGVAFCPWGEGKCDAN